MTNIKFILGVILSLALALISIPSNAQVTISMEKKGNVFLIPGKINGIPLKFVFDTGASQVYLSLTEAQFMIKNGFLSYEDIKGLSQSQIANGEIVENLDVILKEIEIGGIILNNVEASISSNINAPLLLGQSAIQKLGPIKLNGNKLIIEDRINLPTLEKELAIYRKAYMLFCQGKYDQSLTESLEALSICGTSQTRGALYDNIAQVYEKKGNLDRAIEYERLAVSENPGYEQGLYNLGYMLYANNNLEEALQVFEQFILFFGENRIPKPKYLFAAYSYLGTIYAMKGRCKDAEQSFLKSVNLKCNQQACFGLADLYYEMERFDKAAVYLSQGISFEPKRLSNLKRNLQLGLCYVFTSQKDIAHESFLKCQELFSIYYDTIYKAAKKSKNDEEAYISLMYLGVESNLWLARTSKSAQEAVKYFSLCWPLSDSKKAKDYLLYSSACEQLNDTNTSKQILKEGVGRFPDNVDLLFSYSLLLDDKEEILTILKKILQYESTQKPIVFDFGTVYNNIGWSLCCLNRYSEGLPYAEKAVRLNPEHAYAWGTLGHLYFYLNRYEDCVKVLTKALSMDNDENKKEHYEIRSKAYDKMGKNKLAQKDLEMARQYGD